MKQTIYIFLLLLSVSLIFFSCKKDALDPIPDTTSYNPTPYSITIPKNFPTYLNIPKDNPLTVEGVELGRYLYYDGRLCGKKYTMMSCATCHKQQFAFENGSGEGVGTTGIKTPHVMLSHQNIVFNSSGYAWNGTFYKGNPNFTKPGTYGGTLEDVVWIVLYLNNECYSDTNASKAMIQGVSMYPPMFKKAFGSEMITFKNIAKAISQFIYTLISSNSKFDKYLRGEAQLTPSELNGFVIFNTEKGDCFHCHGTILFTTNQFYNNAKDNIFTDPGGDRYSVTHNPVDVGAYRAPTLRNIAVTGPYMHDGRFKTLDEVIDFYSSGLVWSPYVNPLMKKVNQGGINLTPPEKADLKAFLLTLTDSVFITNPAFSKPAGLPE